MKTKSILIIVVLLITAFVMSGTTGLAFKGSGGSQCGFHGAKKSSLENKFYYKAHAFLEHREELGLTDEQVASVKQLKLETKKNLIAQNAQIDILNLDLSQALRGHNIETASVSELVDQKNALESEREKGAALAIADLKALLTAEQYDKLKAIWKK